MIISSPWIVRHRQRGDLIGTVVTQMTVEVVMTPATEQAEAVKGMQALFGVLWSTLNEAGELVPETELPSPSFHTSSEILHTGEFPVLEVLRSIDETLEIATGVNADGDSDEEKEEGNGESIQ